MSIEGDLAQTMFLQMGGSAARVLGKLRETGAIAMEYSYQEYPKMLHIFIENRDIEHTTEDHRGRVLVTVKKNVPVYEQIVVNSEEEEERVLSGGKTSVQIEEERQGLLRRAMGAGVKADPSWSSVRLRRELGDKMDAPEPVDEMSALREKMHRLEEMASMKAKIALLEAQLAAPADDVEDMRNQLATFGIKADRRWSTDKLRAELDRAIAA